MNKIEEKVEQRLQEAQSNKEFKDVGRVSNLKKTKSAYRLIDMSNLSEIEMDEVQAFNIIKKELVWQPIDVTEEKDKGTTSGATFLKLEIRKAVPNKPDNSKEKRASYVMFLNKLQADLSECFNVKQIENLGNNYRKLPISDIISYLIDPTYFGKSLEDKNKVDEHIKKNYKLSMLYGAERLMLQLIEEIFSKRFSNILFCKGDTAYETYKEAKDKEPITDEQSIVLIANLRDSKEKFIQANINNQNQYKNFSEAELKSAMNTNWQLNSISKTAYKEDIEKFRTWVIDYYERKIKRGEIEYETKIELSKPKDNDWSWSEDKKEKSERKSIDNKLIINKKEPLAYIKRTGGYKIGDISVNELIDKFGYKAVNYGNYVDDKWSKQHTKFYLQAMSDLGEIFNINIKELNELGGLNIVFGGKGHKGHAATYYPQTKDINLTKNNGDGSVGHEYGHYFDNLMVDLDKKKAEPLLATENLNSIQDYEVRMAFKNIVDFFQKGNPLYTPKMKVKFFAQENNTIPTIPYFKDRRWEYKKLELKPTIEETFEQCEEILVFDENLYQTQVRVIGYIINHFGLSEYSIEIRLKTSMFYQKSKYNLFNYCYKVPSKYNPNRLEIKKAGDYRTPYWTSNVEMFARAWETILFKKILEKNRRSDYLVSGIDMTDLNVEGFQNPYPSGSELEYLETLYDKLIIEVKKAFNLSDFIAYNTDREDMLVEFESKTKSEIKVGIDVTKGKEEEVVEYIEENNVVETITENILEPQTEDDEDVLKDLQKYSSPNKYNSEIEVGQRYYDNRYQDYYTIEKMTEVISGGDVNATLKYDKGATRTESGDFILYHIDNKQHSLSKEETKDSDAIINNIENDNINKQTIQTQNKTETMQTEKKQNDWINKVPSSEKYSKKVKSTAYKLDPTDKNLLKIVEPFASKDELRQEMSAILFDENGITCTNAHILIHLEAKNLQYEGLFIGDKNKKLFGDVKADQLNVSAYPKWKNIIRENVEDENLYDVDVLAIKTYCEIVERLKFSNQTTRAIKFSYGNDNEKLISFNYGFILTLCESLLLLGYEKCKMVVGRNNQYALFVMNENFNLSMNPANESFALIMPIMITNLEDYGNYDIDMDRGAEFVYSLTNDAIYSNKEYFHKINTNITKAEASNSSSLDIKEVAKIKSKIKKANSVIPILDYCKIENGVLTINDLESIYETKASGYEDGIYEILGESLRKVPNTPLDDYPRTPKNVNIKLAEINRQELVYILDLADNFVSNDDLRPIMTGVSLSYKEGQMVIASTDANKLLRYELSSFHAEKDFSLVLPVNYFDFLRFFDCDNITIYGSENSDEKVLFDCDSRRIYFRNIDGRYPAIDSVIPSETNNQIVISKKVLSEMLATKTSKDKDYQIEHYFYEDGTIKTFNVNRSSYNYRDTESDEKTLVSEYKVDSIRLSDGSTTLNKSHIFLIMPIMVKHEEGETVSLISFRNDILKSMSKLDQSIYEINFTASNRAGVVPIDVYSVAGIPKTPSQKIKEKESLSNKEIVLSISSMIINKLKQDSINIKTRVSKNGVFLYGEKLPNGKISHETYFSFEEIPNQEQINLAILEFKTYSKPKTEYKEESISDDKRRVLEAIETIEGLLGIVDGKDLIKLQKRKSSLEELVDIL